MLVVSPPPPATPSPKLSSRLSLASHSSISSPSSSSSLFHSGMPPVSHSPKHVQRLHTKQSHQAGDCATDNGLGLMTADVPTSGSSSLFSPNSHTTAQATPSATSLHQYYTQHQHAVSNSSSSSSAGSRPSSAQASPPPPTHIGLFASPNITHSPKSASKATLSAVHGFTPQSVLLSSQSHSPSALSIPPSAPSSASRPSKPSRHNASLPPPLQYTQSPLGTSGPTVATSLGGSVPGTLSLGPVNSSGRPVLSFDTAPPVTPVNTVTPFHQFRSPTRTASPEAATHFGSTTVSPQHQQYGSSISQTLKNGLPHLNHHSSSFSGASQSSTSSNYAPSGMGGIPLRPTLSIASGISNMSGISLSAVSSAAQSRQSSVFGVPRRPSTANYSSFLEGVSHVTRVRSPSLRGHSRSGSFGELASTVSASGSGGVSGHPSSQQALARRDSDFANLHASGSSGKPWHTLDDVDEVPGWDDNHLMTPNSPTPRRHGFFSRNPSALSLLRAELFTAEREPGSTQTSPLPIRNTRTNGRHDFDDDEYAERTFVDRRDDVLFPRHAATEYDQARTPNTSKGALSSTLTMGTIGADGFLSPPLGYAGNTGPSATVTGTFPAEFVDDEDERRHLANLDEELVWTDQDLNALVEHDRLGIGLMHEGYPIVEALDRAGTNYPAPDDGIRFEVVRRLGYGSYAIVYLVREVLYDDATDDESLPFTGADGIATRSRGTGTVYGRDFALKCLSKRNLSESQMAVQKLEVTLHQALPVHRNVVALHRAMETPAWLFLVLEYCPGQDLYFWLEQARDEEGFDGEPSRAPSRLSSRAALPTSIMQRWVPTRPFDPPLGESPAPGHFLFDENRDSTPPSPSMLAATADTALLSRRRLRLISRMFVQMCEALQACHDAGLAHRDIKPENIIIVDNRAELGSGGKVTIKITDWGLGTTEQRCEDFDCGSKPYMAYECRNNIMPSYEPKGADVWSLGVVLLNLLFHRCPWADPTMDDTDFAHFSRTPVEFLEKRFEGIGTEVATYLADRVFCSVEESKDAPANRRVTAGEFALWAKKLVRYMGEGGRRASISDNTFVMKATNRQQSPRLEGTRVFNAPQHRSPRSSMEIEGSPSRQPFRLPDERNEIVEELEAQAESHTRESTDDRTVEALALDSPHMQQSLQDLNDDVEVLELDALDQEGEPKNKGRRKRGARKSKIRHSDGTIMIDDDEPRHRHSRPRDHHVHTPLPRLDPLANLAETSQHLQEFAREISQATKSTGSMSSRSGATDALAAKRPSKPRFSDRFKGAFANGNPDLQAFADRARQRDLALSGAPGARNPTASAPAKMEEVAMASVSGISSFGSVASTGSWSEDGRSQNSHWASTGSRRERVKKAEDPSATGIASRNGRPGRSRHHQTHSPAGQASSTVSSSPSRHSFTPASSFSSTTSYDDRSRSIGPSYAARSPLHSIDETVQKPIIDSNTEVADRAGSPQTLAPSRPAVVNKSHSATQIIREPIQPPTSHDEHAIAAPASPLKTATEAAVSNAPKAKLGRLFKTFARG